MTITAADTKQSGVIGLDIRGRGVVDHDGATTPERRICLDAPYAPVPCRACPTGGRPYSLAS